MFSGGKTYREGNVTSGVDPVNDVPEVSVVMSVYNNADHLRDALDGILSQDGISLELIAVDDGSTDGSPAILDEYACRDQRVRVVRQVNAGLTRALVAGCEQARGEFIARQDADDLSLPGRLRSQVELLRSDARLVFVSCWSEVMGPGGEMLLTHRREFTPEQATTRLFDEGNRTGPPGHGSVMFRREAYRKVGGYRPTFYYAQDWDLWLRLGEVGLLGYVQKVGYCYRIDEKSISGALNPSKLPYWALVLESRRMRQETGDDGVAISRFVKPAKGKGTSRGASAQTLYFIGRCLLSRRDSRAKSYFYKCVSHNPFYWRAWLAFPLSLFLWRSSRNGVRS